MKALLRAGAGHGARLAKFAGVGIVNTAIDFGFFVALAATGLAPLAANGAAFLAANAFSYGANARVTFAAGGSGAPVSARGYLKFLLAHAAGLVVSSASIALFSDALGAFGAKLAAAGLTLGWNYGASAYFVFGAARRAARGGPA